VLREKARLAAGGWRLVNSTTSNQQSAISNQQSAISNQQSGANDRNAEMQKTLIGVIGASSCSPDGYELAREIGRRIAEGGAAVVCGGLQGVMEAACRGCTEVGGEAIGILPGGDPGTANPYVTLAVPTNMGHARNVIIAHSARALIAVEGEFGTLSEMAIGLKLGRPVIAVNNWPGLRGVIYSNSAEEAVGRAFALIGQPGSS
jgi:uncharacterized protein (TIGR00725 family)